jgi:hypothetical protein
MENVGIYFMTIYVVYFYGYWKDFMTIWYILWSFGIFLPVLVICTKKNLATLVWIQCYDFDRI